MVTTSFGDTPESFPDVTLPEPYMTDFRQVYEVWTRNRAKNGVRRAYYEGENRLKNIGIAIPPELEDMRIVVGWPKKAVTALANRSRFDGWTNGGDDSDLNAIMDQNAFARKYRQLARSELVHGLAFVTVMHGDADEPDVRIRAYSAVNAACTWDYRLERVKCGLTVHDVDVRGVPTRYVLYEPDCIVDIRRLDSVGGMAFPTGFKRWTYAVEAHPMGRPPFEPLVYGADADYPLGHSRISRAVMDITDRAVRESLRTELASELAATPQKYLLGGTKADMLQATAGKTRWEQYIGSVTWITKDKDGDVPQYGQLPQVSMQPHIDYRAALAAEFAAETSVPIEMLGVQSKTYTSSDSARANLEELVQAAEDMNDDNGASLRTIGRMALAVKRNEPYSKVTDDVIPIFKDPSRPSIVGQADAIVKICSTEGLSWIANTSVALEMLGFNDDQRARMATEKRRIDASQRILQMEQAAATSARAREQAQRQEQAASGETAGGAGENGENAAQQPEQTQEEGE